VTLVHEALYYATVDEFLEGTLDFIRSASPGVPTLVAVPQPRLELLQSSLPSLPAGAAQPSFLNMAEVGRNPARILPWVLCAFADSNPGPVRIIGEPVYLGRTEAELTPCVEHEALINVALVDRDVDILCPYDIAQVPAMVPFAERTHPVVVADGQRRPSRDYTDPAKVLAMLNRPLPEPSRIDERLVFDIQGLAGVRRLVAEHALTAGLAQERVDDLQLAVTEICTNAVVHDSDGLGTLRVWTEDDLVVCEVRGAGQISDILAGRVLPSPERPHGRGLLLANRLCDLVQTHTGPAGTRTRLSMRLSVN
jgi:anti-sigma regulatory factor (Ser/Thr protein kinase)